MLLILKILRKALGEDIISSVGLRLKALVRALSPSTDTKLLQFFILKKNFLVEDKFATTNYFGFLDEQRFYESFQNSTKIFRSKDYSGYGTNPRNKRTLELKRFQDIRWRAHIVCWAANKVRTLDGDFVDCGVAYGILPKTVCEYVDFSTLEKTYFLIDPWGLGSKNSIYTQDIYDQVQVRFAGYPNVKLIRGLVPDALSLVDTQKVAYLGIDMNGSEPERAALEHFYPKMVRGGVIYFDDYGWNFPDLRATVDEFLSDKPESLLHFPNGTAILIKH